MDNNSYKNYETKKTIIDMNSHNTNNNTNNKEEENCNVKFAMQERIKINTKHNDLIMDMLTSSLLYSIYFSIENIKILQNGIRAGIYKMSNEKYVFPQDTTCINLQLIMKSIICQFGDHTNKDIKKEIEMLNEKVFDYCIPFVYKAAISYEIFLKDHLQLVVPLEHSMQTDRDYKQLQYKLW